MRYVRIRANREKRLRARVRDVHYNAPSDQSRNRGR